jgi:hypothetical protein
VRRAIDHHAARLQPLGHPMRVRQVSTLDIGLQAVGGVAGAEGSREDQGASRPRSIVIVPPFCASEIAKAGGCPAELRL